MTDAALKGHAAKPVKAVEFTWYVVQKEGNSTIIIKEGLPTTWIALPEQLREGGELKLRHTGITIRKVLLRSAEIGGERRIEVRVTNVLYADGSSWKRRLRAWRL